jgi:hypothetical protein
MNYAEKIFLYKNSTKLKNKFFYSDTHNFEIFFLILIKIYSFYLFYLINYI